MRQIQTYMQIRSKMPVPSAARNGGEIRAHALSAVATVRHSRKHGSAVCGSTLIEVMVSLAIVAIFFSSLYEANWRSLALLKSAMDGAHGTRTLTTLGEQIRTSTWAQVTSGAYLSGTILPNAIPSASLSNASETIDVNPYPPGTSGQTLEATRSATGAISITKPGDGSLPSQSTIRVDLTIQWRTTFNATPHSRMMSLIVSQSGILGRNQ
jgi:prepilin-type N-terminal cleavage/methylation domain-containing protein